MSARTLAAYLPLAALVALLITPATADAWQLRLERRYMPVPEIDLRSGVAADLDGDGREEYVGTGALPFYSRPVVDILRYDPAQGRVVHAGGAPLPGYHANGRVLVYRVPGTTRNGILATPDHANAGEPSVLLDGPQLMHRTTLPLFGSEVVIAAGDADADGTLDVYTATGTTIHRWAANGTVPLATGTFAGCNAQLFARCALGAMAQLDADAGLELFVGGAQGDVLDAISLEPESHSSFGPVAALELAEIDGDAASEWVALRRIGSTESYIAGVFDVGGPVPLRELNCPSCIGAHFAVGDTSGADGRDELLSGRSDGAYRLDLVTGATSPIGIASEVRTAVDFQGDGEAEIVSHFDYSDWLDVRSFSASPPSLGTFYSQDVKPIRQWTPGRLVLPQGWDTTEGQFRILSWPGRQLLHRYPETPDWQVMRRIEDVVFANADGDGVADMVLLTDLAVHAFSGTDYHPLWRIEPQMVPQRRYPRRIAPVQLDGDPQHELIAVLDGSLEAWDVPTGNVLWAIPASLGSPGALEIGQFDADPGLEVVVSTRYSLSVFDVDSRALQFAPLPPIDPGPGAAMAVADYQGAPRIYVRQLYALAILDPADGHEVARFEDLPPLRGLAAVPGTRLMVGLTEDRAIAFDADTAEIVATSEFLDSSLQSEREPLVRALGGGRFVVEVRGTTAYSELTLDPAGFSDGFEDRD